MPHPVARETDKSASRPVPPAASEGAATRFIIESIARNGSYGFITAERRSSKNTDPIRRIRYGLRDERNCLTDFDEYAEDEAPRVFAAQTEFAYSKRAIVRRGAHMIVCPHRRFV